mmetsp:Transcript_141338/g.451726  ORF Transcript_141338/g.451726 Transcript_141338/m.451726 type:complete len:107 (-) Transcript_141338:135-455(-)
MGAALPAPAATLLQPPVAKREEPCQEEYDAYMKCCKANEMTPGMNDCEDIMAGFQQCMRRSKLGADAAVAPSAELPAGVLPDGMTASQHVGPRSLSAGLATPPRAF